MRAITMFIAMIMTAGALASDDLEIVNRVTRCDRDTNSKRKCEPSPALHKIMRLLGLRDDDLLENIVETTQKAWLRPKGVERWQMQERYLDKRAELLALFRELGLVDAIHSQKMKYDYAALHGATYRRVESRIKWLADEYKRGIRFDSIVILSGMRALDARREIPEIRQRLLPGESVPKNEVQMMKWLWNRVELPKSMRELPVIWVDAAPSDIRAHTGDTVLKWLERKPKVGTILAVSNQPFVSYQDMTMRNRLPLGFEIETIGEPADDTMNAVYLDNLARLLFELQKWEQKSTSK